MLSAAAGTPEEQILQILGAVFSDVVVVLVDLVPCVVVVVDGAVDDVLDFLHGQPIQILGGEQLVELHVHTAEPVAEIVLGTGKVAAADHGIVDRDLVVLEKLTGTDGHRLVGTGDGTHALGEEAHAAACLDDPADLLHGIEVGGEVLLGDDAQKLEHEGEMGAMELVIARHKVHAQGEKRGAGENVVEAGCVIADEEEGTGFLAEVGFEGVVNVVILIDEDAPHQTEKIVDPVGTGNLSGADLLGDGFLFHVCSPFLLHGCGGTGSQQFIVAAVPEEPLEGAGDGPADGEAEIDDSQGAVDGEDHPDPKKTDTADAEDHGNGRDHGVAHAAHGCHEDVENTVEQQGQNNVGQADLADFHDGGFRCVESEEEVAEEPHRKADGSGTDDGQNHGQIHDLLDTGEVAGTDVLTGEGHAGLGECHGADVDKAFDISGGAVSGHDGGGVERIDAGLDHHVAQGEDHALNSRGNTDTDNASCHG